MNKNEWNKEDLLILKLHSPINPLDREHEGLDDVLDFIEALDGPLRPDQVQLPRKRKYSRRLVHEKLHDCSSIGGTSIYFTRDQPTELSLNVYFIGDIAEAHRFQLTLELKPFTFLYEPDQAEAYAQHLLALVRTFTQRFPIAQGMAHSFIDYFVVSNPYWERHRVFKPFHEEAYWLNVYGPDVVEQLGRPHVRATPSHHVEELPGGAVLSLTRPTPADFDSEEARLAQARALAHLHPERKLEDTLTALRARSLLFTPLPLHFHEDVADILRLKMEARGLIHQRQFVEQFSAYQPPPVTEWLPASLAPSPDVDDVPQVISIYEGYFTQQLVPLFPKGFPVLVVGSPQSLPWVDFHLWDSRFAQWMSEEDKELRIPWMGAWLGACLVHALGGRWVPRRKLDEAAVVVGNRAWLPFLRARHAFQGPEAPLDSSCTQLFQEARRLALRTSM